MPPDAWMDWDGWRWVSMVFTACIFFYFGWDARGTKERSRQFLASLKVNPSVALARQLACMKDPRDCPSIEDELEAFADVIDTAKEIHGDLREEDDGADQP
jgi:hypothetical protein